MEPIYSEAKTQELTQLRVSQYVGMTDSFSMPGGA